MPVVELPSSRSSARTPVNTSTPPKKSTRSGTSTPTTTHHHKSADEVALEEAEHLLENVDVEHGDARSRRHEHLLLSRLRSQSVPAGPEVEEDVKAEVEGDDQEDEEGSEEMVSAREDLEDTPIAEDQDVEVRFENLLQMTANKGRPLSPHRLSRKKFQLPRMRLLLKAIMKTTATMILQRHLTPSPR
jgi:hypothetical protein